MALHDAACCPASRAACAAVAVAGAQAHGASSLVPRSRTAHRGGPAAAGAEHAGLFDAVCTTARNVIAQASGSASRRRSRAWRRRAGGPPAPPARETWHAEPVKVFDNLYFLGQTEFSVWAITTSRGHHPARRHLRLLGRGRGGRRAEEAGARPGADQVRDRQPRPPGSRRRRQVPAGALRQPPAHDARPTTTCWISRTRRGSRSATWW